MRGWGLTLLGGALAGSVLAGGCGTASAKGVGQGGGDGYDRVGAAVDDPAAIFAQAGYRPLWTASPAEAARRLPKGLKTMPHEARVWEPWFRKHLTFKGRPLSTAELLRIKWTVIQTVANDPACQFRAGQSDAEVFQSVEAARVKALASLGMDDSNPVLFQISRADAAFARCKSQREYAKSQDIYPAIKSIENGGHPRYPTLNELNQQNYALNCGRSSLEMLYVLRGLEKIRPSGVKIGALYVFRFDIKGQRHSHMINGVRIALPGGTVARLYYEPVAGRNYFQGANKTMISDAAGPLDQASLESLANTHCVSVMGPQLKVRGAQNDGRDGAWYGYVLGENWPEFGLGNFDFSATLPEGGYDYLSRKRGQATYADWHRQNLPSIASLERTLAQTLR